MSRRSLISEALESAKSDHHLMEEEVPQRQQRNFTNKRLEAFGEAARLVKKPSIRLKPSECSIWSGNARDYSLLDEFRLRSLIDSILAEGSNRVPAVVRRTPNGILPYELITGTRRHWAISWLNDNHYPDIDLIAIIEDIDDEAAFRLADIENREREDISDLERGLNYKTAVDAFYGGIQLRMAERLRMSKSQLSRYIALTELPPFIISAFSSPMDLHAKYAEKLLPALRDPTRRKKMEEIAEELASEQSFRRSGDEPALSGPVVLARLLASVQGPSKKPPKSGIKTSLGASIGLVERDQQKIFTFSLVPTDISLDEVMETLRPVIEKSKIFRIKKRSKD